MKKRSPSVFQRSRSWVARDTEKGEWGRWKKRSGTEISVRLSKRRGAKIFGAHVKENRGTGVKKRRGLEIQKKHRATSRGRLTTMAEENGK